MATKNTGKKNASSKPAAPKKPGKPTQVKIDAAKLVGGVVAPGAVLKLKLDTGAKLMTGSTIFSSTGRDCWGNSRGAAYTNRAIIALSAAGKAVTNAEVNALGTALAIAAECPPRPEDILSPHVTHLKGHGLLKRDTPRGVIEVSAVGEAIARRAGAWKPLTDAEKKSVDAYLKAKARQQQRGK